MASKIRRRFKLIVLLIVLTLSISTIFPSGAPRAHAFEAADAETAIAAYNAAFWDESANYFWKSTNHTGNNYQDFWVMAELWELVMDAYLNVSDLELKAQLRAQIDDAFDGTIARYGEDWTYNPYNDDIMWWAMASARAYQITNDDRYLESAEYYFNHIYDNEWDDEFAGGGLWWMNNDRTTKNACINFPAAQTAVFLYNITEDEKYLDAAETIYHWGKTTLTGSDGRVFDRIETVNGAIQGATHYNQGTFIGAAIGLYEITGDTDYLDDAIKAAEYTKQHMVDANGLLRYEGPNGDLKGGKTILLRNLGYFQTAIDARQEENYQSFAESYNEWLAFNADMAWSHRNADNLVDGNWAGQQLSGTFESWSSAAAVQALISLKPQNAAQLGYAVKNPYGRIEAENYNIINGPGMEESNEGGLQLAGIRDGHYAVYKNVDFGSDDGASGFIMRASSGTGGGQIEIRLDALDGPKVGTINVNGTGGWNNFNDSAALLRNEQGNPSAVTGVHDVYLIFKKTNDDYLFNLNWFMFTQTDPTLTSAYTILQAEHLVNRSGLSISSTGQYVDGIHNNAYASYENIDFGSGATGVTVQVASGHEGGSIEVRLGSLDGPLAGTIEIPALGSWDDWVNITSSIDDSLAVGVRDVYLLFHGDWLCNLDWFTFSNNTDSVRDAYSKLEAEHFTSIGSASTESSGDQTYLAGINGANNPYAIYNYIDFGDESPTEFHVKAASDTSGGIIEARIHSMNGPVIATAEVSGTGGWQTFQVFNGSVTEVSVTGKHLVYLLFKGDSWLYNLDQFTFGDPSVFNTPTLPPDPDDDDDTDPPREVGNVWFVPQTDNVVKNPDGSTTIKPIVNTTNGNVVGTVTSDDLKKALEQATPAAGSKKQVIIDVPLQGNAASYAVQLPAESLKSQDGYELTIQTPDAFIQVPGNMLSGTAIQADQVSIRAAKASLDHVDAATREQIGDRPAIELNLVAEGHAVAWNNPAAPVTVAFPYTPTAEELLHPEHILIWYIDGNGNATPVPNSRYDALTGTIIFQTTHFSTYAAVSVFKTFGDLAKAPWAKEAIDTMASRGVIKGTGENTFSPDASIKRADFIALLVRALELHESGAASAMFSDVPADAYYYNELAIAKQLGIATGFGDNTFRPDSGITRQDMMVLTTRALAAIGKQLPASGSLDAFSDAANVAGYAYDSVAALVKAGVVAGKDSKLAPNDQLTRAEAAVILYRIWKL